MLSTAPPLSKYLRETKTTDLKSTTFNTCNKPSRDRHYSERVSERSYAYIWGMILLKNAEQILFLNKTMHMDLKGMLRFEAKRTMVIFFIRIPRGKVTFHLCSEPRLLFDLRCYECQFRRKMHENIMSVAKKCQNGCMQNTNFLLLHDT